MLSGMQCCSVSWKNAWCSHAFLPGGRRRAGSLRVCLPPIFFNKNCFQFLLGITFVPRESENNVCVKFCGVNKLYHGQCERAGECFLTCVFVTYFFRCVLHGVVWQTTFICILFLVVQYGCGQKNLIRDVRKCNKHADSNCTVYWYKYFKPLLSAVHPWCVYSRTPWTLSERGVWVRVKTND